MNDFIEEHDVRSGTGSCLPPTAYRSRRRWLGFVVTLIVLASHVAGRAELLPIRTYTTADGLPALNVYRVMADSRGFLWLCTSEGLARFDGYAITTYTTRDGLPDRRVTDIRETRDGTLWVATFGGLCRLDPQPGGTPFVAESLGDDPQVRWVTALCETRDGRLWVATRGAVFRFEERDGVRVAARVEIEIREMPTALAEDRWGCVWVGDYFGEVHRVEPDDHVETYRLPGAFVGDEILCVFENEDGGLLVGTKEGLFRCEPRASGGDPVVFSKASSGAPAGWINAFHRVRDGTLWIAATTGLWRATDAGASSFERREAIAGACDREIWDIAEDRDRNLWLASRCGAMRVSRYGFTRYTTADGLARLHVDSVFEGREGDLFVTTNGPERTLLRFDGARFTALPPNLPHGEFAGSGERQIAFEGREGDWWLSTHSAVVRYPKADRPSASLRSPPDYVIRGRQPLRLFEDSRGDVWVATTGGATCELFLRERATGTVASLTAEVSETLGEPSFFMAFCETRDGAVWIGTNKGIVVRRASGRFERFTAADGLPAGEIRSLYVNASGRLWIASSLGGLGRVDDPTADRPTFARLTTADGLSSDNIGAVVDDAWGRIYAATSRGVDCVDLATGAVQHFGVADGFPGGIPTAAFRDRRGSLWFATDFGLARLEPEPARPSEPPRTLVVGLRVAGVTRPVAALGVAQLPELDLGPTENSVSVDFLGLGASLGEALRYQYRLEGAGETWSRPSVERTVTFANLAPGSYRFLVRAVNAEGVASPEPAVVVMTIAAPLWRRWWFVLSALALAGLALYVAYKRRVARLLEIERIRTRIATDLHDDIGANLTRIAVLSEVASYRRGTDGDGSLASIARISRESVTSMSDIVWAINPKRDTFRDLVRRMRQLADEALATQGIEVSFTAPDSDGDLRLGHELRRQVYLVYKEAVNNAARHAECERVAIEIALDHGRVSLTISDDGRGFDPTEESDGNGLANMRKRAGAVGARLDVRSTPGEGTTVTFEMPLRDRPV
jgi:signal transduction histidine kinase/ligand-binding sensor domain-containing protein